MYLSHSITFPLAPHSGKTYRLLNLKLSLFLIELIILYAVLMVVELPNKFLLDDSDPAVKRFHNK